MTWEEMTEICKLFHPNWTEEQILEKVQTVWDKYYPQKNGAHSTEKNNSKS